MTLVLFSHDSQASSKFPLRLTFSSCIFRYTLTIAFRLKTPLAEAPFKSGFVVSATSPRRKLFCSLVWKGCRGVRVQPRCHPVFRNSRGTLKNNALGAERNDIFSHFYKKKNTWTRVPHTYISWSRKYCGTSAIIIDPNLVVVCTRKRP